MGDTQETTTNYGLTEAWEHAQKPILQSITIDVFDKRGKPGNPE